MLRKTNLVLIISALILELIPYGAVLYFAMPEGDGIKSYYSYFSTVPYGYANIGPLLAAISTVALLILYLVNMKLERMGVRLASIAVSALASVFAFLPFLMLGFKYVTVIGIFIFLILVANTIALLRRG